MSFVSGVGEVKISYFNNNFSESLECVWKFVVAKNFMQRIVNYARKPFASSQVFLNDYEQIFVQVAIFQ